VVVTSICGVWACNKVSKNYLS